MCVRGAYIFPIIMFFRFDFETVLTLFILSHWNNKSADRHVVSVPRPEREWSCVSVKDVDFAGFCYYFDCGIFYFSFNTSNMCLN